MNRKHFILALVLFLAAALALFWLISMDQPTEQPSRPTPVPVPLAPASHAPGDDAAPAAALPQAASLQPLPQPVPTPSGTPAPSAAANLVNPGQPLQPAVAYLLALLAIAGTAVFAAGRLSDDRLEARGA